MKIFLLISLAICAVSALTPEEKEKAFNDHLKTYNLRLSRSGSETERRKTNFFKNLDIVEQHNEKFKNGDVNYDIGINEFSTFTVDELAKLKTGILPPQGNETFGGEPAPVLRRGRAAPPASWDWRSRSGVVRPVQNQGACGSCWSFAAVGAIEGQMTLKKGRNDKLSEQEIIECAKNPYTGAHLGCKGGWDFSAYNHATVKNGVTSSAYKPYRAVDYLGCYTGYTRMSGSKVLNYNKVTAGNANAVKDYLFNVGPLYVTFYVSSDFYSYRSGVYTDSYRYCNTQYANHAVLLVGYGTQNGVDYWLLKNSWGTNWGESGYFKLQRGRNLCKIEENASYPNLA